MNEQDTIDREIAGIRRELEAVRGEIVLRSTVSAEALDLARENLNTRLEHLNGLHSILRDMVERTVTITHYNAEHKELVRRVEAVEASKNESVGRNAVLVIIMSIVLTAVIHLFIK